MTKCSKCQKSLNWLDRKYVCHWCGKTYCSNCIVPLHTNSHIMDLLKLTKDFISPEYSFTKLHSVLCPTCSNLFDGMASRMASACNNYHNVELVSIHYQGVKHHTGTPIPISTNSYRDRDEAAKELKILVKYYSCDMAIDVLYMKETEEEKSNKGNGVHKYSVYRYRGWAVHKSK